MFKFFLFIKNFALDMLFPSFCLNCQKEGSYLCQDCFSLIEITNRQHCPFCNPPKITPEGCTCKFCKKNKNLDGLYYTAPYNNFIIKKIITQFKYPPYIKELSKPLSFFIIQYFKSFEYQPTFLIKTFQSDFLLIPVPLYKKKLKERGFNQSEEIAKELSFFWKIPLISDVLLKIKETSSQIKLSKEEREKNLKEAFICKNFEKIKGKKIILIDDVFTTGSTMEECSRILKQAGAKEILGIVIARE